MFYFNILYLRHKNIKSPSLLVFEFLRLDPDVLEDQVLSVLAARLPALPRDALHHLDPEVVDLTARQGRHQRRHGSCSEKKYNYFFLVSKSPYFLCGTFNLIQYFSLNISCLLNKCSAMFLVFSFFKFF